MEKELCISFQDMQKPNTSLVSPAQGDVHHNRLLGGCNKEFRYFQTENTAVEDLAEKLSISSAKNMNVEKIFSH